LAKCLVKQEKQMEERMAWEKPKFEEVCCGFEVTMYLSAELS
jgi:coenzyme PQQ precursor peptide PqqA